MNVVVVRIPSEFRDLEVSMYGTGRNAETGKLELQPITQRPVTPATFKSTHSYILDAVKYVRVSESVSQ
jgi:hypothetical protein